MACRARLVVAMLPALVAGCEKSGRLPAANSSPVPPAPTMMASSPRPGSPMPSPDRFANAPESGYRLVAQEPVSTFSLTSDTASYAIAKRLIREGRLPHSDMVRPEEFINAFRYDYPAPRTANAPFAPFVSVHPAPWDPEKRLLHIGIRSFAPPRAARPPLNLVFLVDVSGSMEPPDRLELVTSALRLMLPQLGPRDRVSLVTYAGKTAVVLDSVPGDRPAEIGAALAQLTASGGTAGGAGLATAYDLAAKNFDPRAVNRVILATDGDFNLGPTSPRELEVLVTEKRRAGVYLTTLGVGLDNLNDRRLQALARAGNGTSAYVGNVADAHRALVEDLAANTIPVADDVKVQVEFNPALVSQYRLIGYETRALRREDFNNDRVDAGEVGSGHAVTAIYEFVPRGSRARLPVNELRYGAAIEVPRPANAQEFAFLAIRYKLPGETRSQLITHPILRAAERPNFAAASEDARFATAVAGFAQALRGGTWLGSWGMEQIAAEAAEARGADADGRRAEFIALVRLAAALRPVAAR